MQGALFVCSIGSAVAADASIEPSGRTLYCSRGRVYSTRTELVCNWATSVATACKDNEPLLRLPKATVDGEPLKATRCASGEWLVKINPRQR